MNAAESFVLPPMARVAEPGALEAWLGDPDGEARILVAEGRVAPKTALAWVLVHQWKAAGFVDVVSEPVGAGEWRWIAVRQLCAMPAAPGARGAKGGRSAEPLAADGTPVSDHIFRAIKRAANMGLPAPSLATLAKGAGMKAPANAKYYVDRLKVAGKIGVETKVFAGGERRRYRILDTHGVTVKQSGWSR
ncbi:hypothetical protein FHR22_002598 [Sphingopyxis panaciterrae]|uniref:hypothetical protein n=1 Tax=Sphingopyxis panaciterrae TaxID=363841 RepID=UPI001420ACBC|nr:hypothetical protein [Sphingopyxis panaciterrae]NIJ37895.1 hypothetical protein [Sphingopyxis panaciterrae]